MLKFRDIESALDRVLVDGASDQPCVIKTTIGYRPAVLDPDGVWFPGYNLNGSFYEGYFVPLNGG